MNKELFHCGSVGQYAILSQQAVWIYIQKRLKTCQQFKTPKEKEGKKKKKARKQHVVSLIALYHLITTTCKINVQKMASSQKRLQDFNAQTTSSHPGLHLPYGFIYCRYVLLQDCPLLLFQAYSWEYSRGKSSKDLHVLAAWNTSITPHKWGNNMFNWPS